MCRDLVNLEQLDFQGKGKNVKEIPMVEIVFEILKTTKNTYLFNDLVKEVIRLKEIPEEQATDYMVQLFTEMNIDGRFIHLGQGEWGLKRWYPADPTDFLVYSRDEDEESVDYDEEDDFAEEDYDDSEEDIEDEDIEDEEDDEDVDFEDDSEIIDEEEVSLDDDDEFDDEELSYEDDVEIDEEDTEDTEDSEEEV